MEIGIEGFDCYMKNMDISKTKGAISLLNLNNINN